MLAQALFERVLGHAGLDLEWKLRLAPLEADPSTPDLMGEGVPFGAGAPRTGPISSISFDDDFTTIHYAPHLLERVELFVAAMAYELAHVLVLAPAELNALPGVDSLDGEFLEVAATFLGFGVFTANSVFNLETFQGAQTQGWNVHNLGVLSEIEVSYALALFLALRGVGARPATEHLRPNPRSYVRAALRVIERDGNRTLAALRAIRGTSAS